MPSLSKHEFQPFAWVVEDKNLIFSKNFICFPERYLQKSKRKKIPQFSTKSAD